MTEPLGLVHVMMGQYTSLFPYVLSFSFSFGLTMDTLSVVCPTGLPIPHVNCIRRNQFEV